MKNLFVGNLGSEVTHEELRRLFEAYGQVVQVHIIVDRDTGLPRGFAFVEMTNDAEAEKAIKALKVSARFATTEGGPCTFPGATPVWCSATLLKKAVLPRLSRRIGVQLRNAGL